MSTFINLDINNIFKTTDYGFQVNASPLPIIYFRLYEGDYVLNYDYFQMLTLTVKNTISLETNVYQLSQSRVVELDGYKYVKWNVPANLLVKKDKLEISARVRTNTKNVLLKKFKLTVYSSSSTGMEAILTTIRSFNYMYSLYLDSIKRTEINQPLGVVGLDSNGKFNEDYLPAILRNHIGNTLYDTLFTIDEIHGLKINRETYELLYYDNDDEEWYVANSIFGGRFGYGNKPSPLYNVFGGYFETVELDSIDSSTFNDAVDDIVDASSFDVVIDDVYDGGLFSDTSSGGNLDRGDPIFGGGFKDKANSITGGRS